MLDCVVMIDEVILQTKFNKLNDLRTSTRTRLSKIEHLMNSLGSIRIINETPKDKMTGQTITEARRQAIYDACAPVADALIAEG